MSDAANILLPAARVAFFVSDNALAQTAQAIADDWRFARVTVQSFGGDIETAIATYGHEASPELVIIETADITDAFIERLGALAGVCAQGTDAVIIGPKNDVHLYRSLVGMGVRDYLVRPVREQDLVQVIGKTLLDKKGMADSRLAVVIGAKGGMGVTAVAQNLAWMAAEAGHKTLLFDAAGSSGTLGIALGQEGNTSLSEAIRLAETGSEDDMKRMLLQPRENLSLLISGAEPQLVDHADAEGVERMVQRLIQRYPFAVFDASGAARSVQKRLLALASHVTVVTTPLLPSLRNARALLAEIKLLRGGLAGVDLALNMQGLAAKDEVPAQDIKAALELEPAARITFAPALFVQADSAGAPAAAQKSGAELRRQLEALARRAAPEGTASPADTGGGKTGKLGLFKKIIGK